MLYYTLRGVFIHNVYYSVHYLMFLYGITDIIFFGIEFVISEEKYTEVKKNQMNKEQIKEYFKPKHNYNFTEAC